MIKIDLRSHKSIYEQITDGFKAVSYTHLDVYKRQIRELIICALSEREKWKTALCPRTDVLLY